LRWLLDVVFAQAQHEKRAEDEQDRGQQVRQPEAHVLLRVDHGHLTSQRADIDEQIVAHIDSRDRDTRIDDNALTGRLGANVRSRVTVLVLLGHERRDAGFEEADSASE
jgi:hypothetical protein